MNTEKLPMPQIVTQDYPSVPQPQKNSGKKHVIWAVAVISIVVVVVTGLGLGYYFFSHTTRNIVKHYQTQFEDDGQTVEENIDSDETGNTELYHIHRGDGDLQYVLKDFDRDLEVYKVPVYNGGHACYITPLDKTRERTPKDFNDHMDNKNRENDTSSAVTFTASNVPISNPSFLGPKAQELCGDHPVYWLNPTCGANDKVDEISEKDPDEGNDEDDHSRVKRSSGSDYSWKNEKRCKWGCGLHRKCCHLISYVKTYNPTKCTWLCEKEWGGSYTRTEPN